MKIAQLAPPWIAIPPKNYGGTENVIAQLTEAQVALGHDVTLFATASAQTSARLISFFPKPLTEDGVPWTEHLKAYYHLHKAVEAIKEEDFDIVHAHLSSSADMYVFPLLASCPIPHIATLHSHFPFDDLPGQEAGRADQHFMDWAPSLPIVTISESARREEKMPLNFAGVVHHGVLLEQFPLPKKPLRNYFVWLGRFVKEKGAHLAVEVAKRAGVHLILAGTIDRYARESREYFHETIKPLIDGDQIRYVGPVSAQQKNGLFGRARAFLNPIEWEEPFGMVMIEAMAVGCPVISFARGAAPEIVRHGETGFLVQNVDEMLEKLQHIDEIKREKVRSCVEEHFSAQTMAKRYINVYDNVIAMSKKNTVPSLPPV